MEQAMTMTLAFNFLGYDLSDEQVAQITMWSVRVAGVLAMLLLAWFVAAWAGVAVERASQKARLELTLSKFFGKLAKWAVLVAGVLMCLSVFGVQTTSFAALIGAGGLAMGLAFQGTLSNFAAGVMLLAFRPFRIGDAVNLAGHTGVVDEIELFTTRINTFDNRLIIIPNSAVIGSVIENITANPVRRADVNVGTDYAADLDMVRGVLEKAAASVPGQVPDREPQVVLDALGDSSINWQVRVWAPTPDYLAVRQATVRAVKRALDEAGIGIPFPQREFNVPRELIDAIRGRMGDGPAKP